MKRLMSACFPVLLFVIGWMYCVVYMWAGAQQIILLFISQALR